MMDVILLSGRNWKLLNFEIEYKIRIKNNYDINFFNEYDMIIGKDKLCMFNIGINCRVC